jgi:hypothetical protein
MSNVENDIKQLEANIERAKELVKAGESIERLRNNVDFKEVILKGYFEREAIRLVHLKADPNMQTPERQASILLQMDAIGALSSYLNTGLVMADRAAQAIEADTETITELLVGGSDE